MPRNRTPSPQTIKVLRALAADPARWRYGYELGTETRLKAGSLYPILARLADRGLLEASWEKSPPPGRPARHLYRLSRDGQELAAVAAPAAQSASASLSTPATRSAPGTLSAPAAPARAARARRGIPQPDGA